MTAPMHDPERAATGAACGIVRRLCDDDPEAGARAVAAIVEHAVEDVLEGHADQAEVLDATVAFGALRRRLAADRAAGIRCVVGAVRYVLQCLDDAGEPGAADELARQIREACTLDETDADGARV